MKKIIATVLTLFALSLVNDVHSSHVVGGEINYRCLGNDQYEISLRFYRDCSGVGFPDPARIEIYDINGTRLQTLSLPFPGATVLQPTPPGPCTDVPNTACVEVAVYTGTVVLPPRPGGYQLGYTICCRNNTITNGPASRAAYYTYIPDISLAQCNSNAKFEEWPPVYICKGMPLSYNHYATDADGDSLVYKLCTPLESVAPNQPYNYINPYTYTNPLGGTPIQIDTQTGMLTGTPNTLGQFVVGVCVDEYRNGQLISTTTRDFQFNVVECENVAVASALTALTNCNDFTVTFYNSSTGNITGYFWDFGDGVGTSTDPNPSYNYPGVGNYPVTLIAYSTNPLCNDTLIGLVAVADTCRPCGMSLSATVTPADCQPGGCMRATCTVPCTDCSTTQLQCGGSSASGNFCSGSSSVSGSSTACSPSCGCVVRCGFWNRHSYHAPSKLYICSYRKLSRRNGK